MTHEALPIPSQGQNEAGTETATGALRPLELLALFVIVGLGVVHLQAYARPFEDSYITYRYAENLAAGIGLVYNPGEYVEGFTCFSWAVLLAGLAWLGLPLDVVAPALSQLASVTSLVLVWHVTRRALPTMKWAALLAPAWLAAQASWAYFGASGMETTVFLAVLLGSVATAMRPGHMAAIGTGALWALAAATRPEGVGYVVALAFALALGRDARRHALIAFAVFLALSLPVLLVRYSYYGSLLPNTFHAKSVDRWGAAYTGWRYTEEFLSTTGAWLGGFVALALMWLRRMDRAVRLATCLVAAGLLNVLFVGADTFALYRFLLPAAAGLAVAAPWLVQHTQRPATRAAFGLGASGVIVWTLLGSFAISPSLYGNKPAAFRRAGAVERINADYFRVGEWLRDNLPPDAVLAVNAAGIVPWTARLVTIDMLGLTDEHIARYGQTDPGAPVGHQRYDADYVLERRPDVIIPGLPVLGTRAVPPEQAAAWWRLVANELPSDRALFAHPALAANYRLVSVPVDEGAWLTFYLRADRLGATP